MPQEFELNSESMMDRDLLMKFLETRAAEAEPAIPNPIGGHTFESPNNSRTLITQSLIYMFCNGGYSAFIENHAGDSRSQDGSSEVTVVRSRQSVGRNQLRVDKSL